MNTFKRAAIGVAAAGMLAAGLPTAANAAPAEAPAPATCYGKATKPFIVGGVGTTAKGAGVIYCAGGTVLLRGSVTLQKQVGGIWRNQGSPTVKTAYVGGRNVQFPDTNPASPGVWRTAATFTIVSNGQTRTFFSGQVRFVPARHGVTI